jgi:tRNA pseudouridine38-40 synthase
MKKIEVSYLLKGLVRTNKRGQISDPVVYGNTEWISVMLHGQSFMLHQVPGRRKMWFLCLPSR